MKPNEFESHIVGAINSAIKDGVHPAIVYMVLHSHAENVMRMVKDQPRQEPPDGGVVLEVVPK